MNEFTKERIRNHLFRVMNRIIDKRVIEDPFDESTILDRNPFGGRLVPIEIWLGSTFERSFVTSLGQAVFEQLARIIAEGSDAAHVHNQYVETFQINTFRSSRIDDLLSRQRRSDLRPDWYSEVNGLLQLQHPDLTTVRSISDLFIERLDGSREYYSLKTVKPNLDQTEIAKRDMLKLKAFNPDYETYFCLPFNPAGEGMPYRRAKHTMPYKLFNMDDDECVLIGADFWNKVGNDPYTYVDLLDIFSEIGEYSSQRIRAEYLGIEVN